MYVSIYILYSCSISNSLYIIISKQKLNLQIISITITHARILYKPQLIFLLMLEQQITYLLTSSSLYYNYIPSYISFNLCILFIVSIFSVLFALYMLTRHDTEYEHSNNKIHIIDGYKQQSVSRRRIQQRSYSKSSEISNQTFQDSSKNGSKIAKLLAMDTILNQGINLEWIIKRIEK